VIKRKIITSTLKRETGLGRRGRPKKKPNIIRVIKSRRMRWMGHVAVWGRGEVHTGFWWGDLREGEHLEDPGVDGRIILKWIFKEWDGGMYWIDMAQDRDRWRGLVNAVMNLRVP
jgi:hypothetical protein